MEPILVAHLVPVVEAKLVELLRSLAPDEWRAQTVSPQWQVLDVAAHLLDTNLRKISIVRDGHVVEFPGDLVPFINRLNAEGVRVYRRLSPPVLIALLEYSAAESSRFHASLDPFAPAAFPVSWAGEDQSLNWFDTARELTERWHHQQQIRLATNRPGIMTPELYHPVLDCFLRILPHAYRTVPAEAGSVVEVVVSGDCGGVWRIEHHYGAWRFARQTTRPPIVQVTIPQEIAWRVFTKGITAAEADPQIIVAGDRNLALPALRATAIVG